MCFFDAQNLRRCVKAAFGYDEPNYNPLLFSQKICDQQGWECRGVHLYSGVPSQAEDPEMHLAWQEKAARMRADGITVYTRDLSYRSRRIHLPDGSSQVVRVAKEKGIDVRISLDVLELTYEGAFDVAVLFCRDQDLSELVPKISKRARIQNRAIKIASAFPLNDHSAFKRGIKGTHWIQIDKNTYDECLYRNDVAAAAEQCSGLEIQHSFGS